MLRRLAIETTLPAHLSDLVVFFPSGGPGSEPGTGTAIIDLREARASARAPSASDSDDTACIDAPSRELCTKSDSSEPSSCAQIRIRSFASTSVTPRSRTTVDASARLASARLAESEARRLLRLPRCAALAFSSELCRCGASGSGSAANATVGAAAGGAADAAVAAAVGGGCDAPPPAPPKMLDPQLAHGHDDESLAAAPAGAGAGAGADAGASAGAAGSDGAAAGAAAGAAVTAAGAASGGGDCCGCWTK